MLLKPQDVLVLLKLVAIDTDRWTYNHLAISIGISPSEVHASIKRSISARLAVRRDEAVSPNISRLSEFLVHGIQYVFVPDRSALTRGLPTSYAASPLQAFFADSGEPPPVWPEPSGTVRGQAFSPLYKSVPVAVQNDNRLYELLVLVDAIRGGGTREYQIAIRELEKRLSAYAGE